MTEKPEVTPSREDVEAAQAICRQIEGAYDRHPFMCERCDLLARFRAAARSEGRVEGFDLAAQVAAQVRSEGVTQGRAMSETECDLCHETIRSNASCLTCVDAVESAARSEGEAAGEKRERERVVRWLKDSSKVAWMAGYLATEIERGDHLAGEGERER